MIHIILFCNLLFGISAPHTGNIAEYKYQMNGDRIQFIFMIDLDDLKYLRNDDSCDFQKMNTLCTSKYINTNNTLYINKKPIKFTFDESSTQNNHLFIYFISDATIKNIKSVAISNNCFYEYNQEFKNRIILDLSTFQSSYLLTKDKSEISLIKQH